MIGTLLITHGTLGESFIQCACHVLNQRPTALAQLGVSSQDDPNQLLALAQAMLRWVDQGHGVLILTDIYGATPSNLARQLLRPGYIEGIAGLSLPMLLRVLSHRGQDSMDTLLSRAITGGCEGALHFNH